MKAFVPVQTPARLLSASAAVATAVVTACVLSLALRGRSLDVAVGLWITVNAPLGLLALWIAVLILQWRPGHGAGRILLAMGALAVLHVVVGTWTDVALSASGFDGPLVGGDLIPAELPLTAAVPLLIMSVLWIPAAVLGALLIAYFPDGRLGHPTWRWIPATAVMAALVLMTGAAADAWPTADWVDGDGPAWIGATALLGGLAIFAVIVGGAVAFGLRWRASTADRRSYEAVGGVLIVVALTVLASYPWAGAPLILLHLAFAAFLGTYGVAVARYRLHGVEPVVSKRLLAGSLSVLLVGIYVGAVIGAGAVVSQRDPHPVLPLVGVAVAVLAAAPLHRVVRDVVDRLLYDRRTSRVELLAQIAARPDAATDDRTLADVAELVRRGTGGRRVEIDVDSGDASTTAAAGSPLDAPPRALAGFSDADAVGEIRVFAHAPGDLFPDAEEVLAEVARLLSMLLENARLSRTLADRLDETRASRQRLVEAQDRARRDLERDIHDGVQARLIAIRMHLGDLERRSRHAGSDDLAPALSRVGDEVDAAVRQLRDLARGLHPPALAQLGVGPAVQAFVRDAALPVALTVTGTDRHPETAESAAYFACLEAIQNALRHGDNASIAACVTSSPTHLGFTVSDDGPGFDPDSVHRSGLDNLTDRILALGGQVGIRSGPGIGTRVTATITPQSETADR